MLYDHKLQYVCKKRTGKKKLLFFLLTFGKLLSYVQGVPYEKACLKKASFSRPHVGKAKVRLTSGDLFEVL